MSISGFLETFSLSELFRLLDSGSKSGKLTIQTLPDIKDRDSKDCYYIWFYKGKLIAFNHGSQDKHTLDAILSRGWLSDRVLEKLIPLCPEGHPLGTYFKSIGALKEQQLNLLFQISLAKVLELFELANGEFQFEEISGEDRTDTLKNMPWLEMTGVSLKGTEVALLALRRTKNWERFSGRLPELSSGLQRLSAQPQVRLDPLEISLWKHANGITPLEEIAKQEEQLSVEVQKGAFRLLSVGLVEEIPQAILRAGMANVRPLPSAAIAPAAVESSQKKPASEKTNIRVTEKLKVSSSLLQNFLDFLKNKF